MKNDATYFVLCILFGLTCLCGCQRTWTKHLLSDAEIAMRTDIDKANRILDNIPHNRLSQQEQADYNRLKAISIVNLFQQWGKADSLNNLAIDYYREMNDTINLKKTLRFSSNVAFNTNKPDLAIERLSELESLIILEDNFREKSNVYSLLSNNYLHKADFNAAIRYANKAILATDKQDSLLLAYNYRRAGEIHAHTHAVDSAMYYYWKALDISMIREEMNVFTSQTFNEMSKWMLSNNDFKRALEYNEKSTQYRVRRNDVSLLNLTKARIFIAMNETDSARFYLNRTIESSDNTYFAIIAYQHLSDLYGKVGNDEQEYYKMINYSDLIQDAQSVIESNVLRQQFKEIQLENENNALKLAKRNRELFLLSIIFMAAITVFIFGYLYSRAKRKDGLLLQKRREDELKNKATIAEQENQLLKQEKELIQLQEKATALRALLFRKLSVSEKIPSLDVWGNPEKEQYYKKIALNTSDWEELIETIDALFNGFTHRLKKAVPHLSAEDVRFCCLLKINISMQDLADIYCISKAGITKKKMRMKKEKFNLTDSQLDLNDFLMTF